MYSGRTATGHNAGALRITEDEELACACAARLLISASTNGGAERLARRVHGQGRGARYPFVDLWARDFPVELPTLREYCGTALDRAAGGSLLIGAVEEMAPTVQAVLIELLAALELSRRPSAAVRLMSGTTVSLMDRTATGTFSTQLFYHLNTIHLIARDRVLSLTVPGI